MTKALVDDCPERMNMGTQNAERLCLDHHLSDCYDYNQQTFEYVAEDGDYLQLSMVGEEILLVEVQKWVVMVFDHLYGCYTQIDPVACYITEENLELYSKDFRIHLTNLMEVPLQMGDSVFDVYYSEVGGFDQHCYTHNLRLQI